MRSLQDIFTIGIKSQIPQHRTRHEFSVPSNILSVPNSICTNSVPAFIPSLTFSTPFRAFNIGCSHVFKSFFNLSVSRSADSTKPSIRSLFSSGRIRGITSFTLGERRIEPLVVDSPVVDPLSQGIGVEDAAEEHDGLLGGIQVLK